MIPSTLSDRQSEKINNHYNNSAYNNKNQYENKRNLNIIVKSGSLLTSANTNINNNNSHSHNDQANRALDECNNNNINHHDNYNFCATVNDNSQNGLKYKLGSK
jgi:hypothetical protein